MNTIVIINGKGGVGKDTFITLCQNYTDNIVNISSVSYVKEVARYCGWNGEKDFLARRFLSDVKDSLTRWKDVPFQKMVEEVKKHKNKIIFIHVREPEEIDRLKKELKAKTLLIKNDGLVVDYGNHADDFVEKYDYDYVIDNSSTISTLEQSAKTFVDIIKSVDKY